MKRVLGNQPIDGHGPRRRRVRIASTSLLLMAPEREETGVERGSNDGGTKGKLPKEGSLTDPEAAVERKNTDPFLAYDANNLNPTTTPASSRTLKAHAQVV